MYSQLVGPFDTAIQAICKNNNFSELYEIGALCSLLKCNIRTILPNIDTRYDLEIFNSAITSIPPIPPIIANCTITILWSNAWNEIDARMSNNGNWSPNHFVPLMLPVEQNKKSHHDQSNLTLVVSYIHVNKSLKCLKFT